MTQGQNGNNGDVPDDPETPYEPPDSGSVTPQFEPAHEYPESGGHQHPIYETYFQSGEMLLHARYDANKTGGIGQLNNAVNTWFQKLQAKALPPTYQDKCKLNDKLVRFGDDLAGSLLVSISVEALQELRDDELEAEVNRKLGHSELGEDEPSEDEHPEYDENRLNAAREFLRDRDIAFEDIINAMNSDEVAGFDDSGITLQAASPNWLFSTMPHIAGHPSPGGWPVPVPAASLRPRQHEFKTRLIDQIINTCAKIAATPEVDVVIFDTAPAEGSVTIATPRSDNPDATRTFPEGPLRAACSVFQDLCQGRLSFEQRFTRIARADQLGILLPLPPPPDGREITDPHFTNRDGYNVSDHGLFIAGIVHSLAPQANIHLVEIMNSHGMGTLESLIAGVEALIQGRTYQYQGKTQELPKPRPGRALIVNCSLGLDLPRPVNNTITLTMSYRPPGSPIYRLPGDLTNTWTVTIQNADRVIEAVHATFGQLEAAFSAALAQGGDGVIVASAGNDGLPGQQPPPPAHYPAAFPNVLAVGALEDASNRAWYSNLADSAPYVFQSAAARPGEIPPPRGVVVTGGRMDFMHVPASAAAPAAAWSQSNAGEGILGIYIGKFPTWNAAQTQVVQERSPSSGWARWAGTSFSAGVMSGILARAASKRCIVNPADKQARDFLRKLREAKMPLTQYGEIILSVPQGAPWWVPIWEWIRNFLGLNKRSTP